LWFNQWAIFSGNNYAGEKNNFALSGADEMVTIFSDFSQFPAKKLAFFLETNVFPSTSSILSQRTPIFFAKFFGENRYF
jgi:hypothetical protein